jgi:hypothetical protein
MNASLRQAVRQRARRRCEYCHLPETDAPFTGFQIEHVIARQHGGETVLSNLAFACHRCNLFKGPNLAGIDPETKQIVKLFHPRRMKWALHFRWVGPLLVGRTATGRATVAVLNINESDRVALRRSLLEDNVLLNGHN